MRFFLAVFLFLFFTLSSFADVKSNRDNFSDKYYIGFAGGYSYTMRLNETFTTASTQDSGQLSFFVGRKIFDTWRIELEGNYKTKFTAKSETGARIEQEFESFASMVNLYKFWNYRSAGLVHPFVMGGFGMSYNIAGDYKTYTNVGQLTSLVVGKKSLIPSYQVGTGVSFKMNEASYMDFSLRYINRGDADSSSTFVNSVGDKSSVPKRRATIKDVVGLVGIRMSL